MWPQSHELMQNIRGHCAGLQAPAGLHTTPLQELQERPACHLACKQRKPQNSKRCKKWTKSENESKHVCLRYTTTRNVYLSEVPIAQAQTRKFR